MLPTVVKIFWLIFFVIREPHKTGNSLTGQECDLD